MVATDPAPAIAGPEAHAVRVSVLVPVLDEAAHLDAALAGMRAQEDPGGPIELLFADGGSTDGTRARLDAAAERDPWIRVLDNPARLTTPGLNVALAAARGEYVARMDAHTRYPPGYLRTGVQRLERGDVAHVSGPQIAEGTDPWSRRVALALHTRLGVGGASFRRPIASEIDVPSGFTGVWRAQTLRDAGGWDARIYPNEDAELAARIRRRGGRIVCVPDMAAAYAPRGSLGALGRQYWRYGQGRARTSLRHPAAAQVAHLAPPGLVLALAGSVAPSRRVRRGARAGLLAYGAALAGTTAVELARRSPGAAFLPAVLATMHLSWGSGFLVGLARHGRASRPEPAIAAVS